MAIFVLKIVNSVLSIQLEHQNLTWHIAEHVQFYLAKALLPKTFNLIILPNDNANDSRIY
jgi:hypothetical protein